jgi:hypothetical protein
MASNPAEDGKFSNLPTAMNASELHGDTSFSMIPARFKPRNPARFVMITNAGLETVCEIDRLGNLISTKVSTSSLGKQPVALSELSEQESPPTSLPKLEFPRLRDESGYKTMGDCESFIPEKPTAIFAVKNLLN